MEYELKRTGDRLLRFDGEVLAEADTQWVSGKQNNRWHEIAIYRTNSGKYVVAISYYTKWQGEIEYREAIICSSAEEAVSELKIHDPTAHVMGYPPGTGYAEKQDRMLTDLILRFKNAVSEVLDSIEPEAIC